MSVSENIALVAGYARQGGLISWRETREIGRQLLDEMLVRRKEPDQPRRTSMTF
jgi:ABC-type sugar transport system ATPase subunit